jgi:alpha-galactosidase
VVVLAWWGPRQHGYPPPRVRLAGLDPSARYTNADTGTVHPGSTLVFDGIELPGAEKYGYGSALIRLKRAG